MRRLGTAIVVMVLMLGVGASGATPLLEIGSSARAVALGGALVALADDENALFYNPAALAILERPRLSLFYQRVFEVVHHVGVGGAMRSVGLQILQIDTGSAEATNEFGNPTGMATGFFERLGLFGLALGSELFAIGGRVQFYQTPAQTRFAIDVAARVALGVVRVGAFVHDLFSTESSLDLRVGTGLIWAIHPQWTLSLGLDIWRLLTGPELHVGVEVSVNSLRMRVGYDGVAVASGAGVRWGRLQLDWAYRVHPFLPASTIVTVTYLF
ncbi:MAG: hypothetical protein NZ610_07275 [Candidatus Bipolaricaulota bacterium]|nr:hypothetical protein [Candidatus Bipolaricaulota bacterium]MCS7275181.1 hypothetical protein [Candidatus Bipolaricaulota bacterium]MDW8110450.1 hypothetical protein [Candidatus Bipolaricaulota bacterium]MDW8329680.1 hypothetical protein [Candidatus Bipolaricaulota bacterium]